MLPDASRGRRRISIVLAGLLSVPVGIVLSPPLRAEPQAVRVLLVVPPGADLAAMERARSSVPAAQTVLLVAASDRVRVKGGLEALVDLPLTKAPAADLVVLLAGEEGQAESGFLLERRRTARAILLPPGSRLAETLRSAEGAALILLGSSDAIPAVLEALGSAGPVSPPAPRPTVVAVSPAPPAPLAPPPAATPTRAATGRVFERYFSSRPIPTPTPAPTPR
jgi:hypothetical protein